MRQLLRDARAAITLFRLVRLLEREREELRGAKLEIMVEPDWHIAQRRERARLTGKPEPTEPELGWEALYFVGEGIPARVGRGHSCDEALRAAMAKPAPSPLPLR